jgi:hypothetical protein
MRAFLRKYPWHFAAICGVLTFTVCSAAPIWRAWSIGDWEANSEPASFWAMLASVPPIVGKVGAPQLLFTFYGPELLKAAVIVAIGVGVERFVAGLSRIHGSIR